MDWDKTKYEIRGFISSDPTIQHLFDEISSIREYVNDMHLAVREISDRVSKIEGSFSLLLKIGIPILTSLIVGIITLLIKIALG